MKKKCFLALALIPALALTSLTFAGCGKEGKGSDVYALYDTQITRMKKTGNPFNSATIDGATSSFVLKSFNNKVDGEYERFGYHNGLIARGLDFINKYYPRTQNYTKKHNIQKLSSSIDNLVDAYNNLLTEYTNFTERETEVEVIYNGYMARYGESAREFSMAVYDSAIELSNYMSTKMQFDSSVGTDNATSEAIQFYMDARKLEIFNDFNDYLMDNCKGVMINDSSYNAVVSLYQSYSTISYNSLSSTTSAYGKKIKTVFDRLDAQRDYKDKALDHFSYYDYSVFYNGNIEAYKKKNSKAEIHLSQSQDYFWKTGSTLQDIYNFITN